MTISAASAKTQAFIDADLRYGAHNYKPLPVALERGDRVFVWDVDGKRYFDMLSAYSAVNQGHNCRPIIEAAKRQMDKLYMTSRAFHNTLTGEFLRKVCEITRMEQVLPMNTGAEACETAVKAMRKWGYQRKGIAAGKAEIIVAANNFHGRTTTMVSLSTDPASYGGYEPKTPGFQSVPYNDPAALEAAITPNTCGFLVEPVQGEAGVLIPAMDYLNAVREICTRHDILLAVDEVQTGLGRTGRMFCFEHNGIRPDIIIMGKALSGGLYPISGIAANASVMDVFQPGTHGSTFGGNPLAAAIGIAAVDYLVTEKLAEKSAAQGDYFLGLLNTLRHPKLTGARGKGLLLAIEFTEPVGRALCLRMMERGLLAKDTHGTTVRFAPPLVITRAELDEAFAIIRDALAGL